MEVLRGICNDSGTIFVGQRFLPVPCLNKFLSSLPQSDEMILRFISYRDVMTCSEKER